MDENLEKAYDLYCKRQNRQVHPDGKFDNGGRWYPSDQETCSCCHAIRSPSRSYPYSLLVHCRTSGHIAKLFGVSSRDLARMIRERGREGGDEYYKAVALLDDGRMVSLYDGTTEYQIGVTLQQAAHQNHSGGYYVHPDLYDAENIELPSEAWGRLWPCRAILRVRCEGSYCRYDRKLAFSRITPLEVVEVLG